MMKLKGSSMFRSRIVCSVLSSKAITITDIRAEAEEPGLSSYEINFLKLVTDLTNGTKVKIDPTGLTLNFTPGHVYGGSVNMDVSDSDAPIGYYLEAVLPLCLFSKRAVTLEITSVTDDDAHHCVNTIQYVSIPLLKRFGLSEEELPVIKLVRRGAAPNGKGTVILRCPIIRGLKTCQLMDVGLIKRVRGLSYCIRVSPQISNRMVDKARAVFNNFIPDVYINTDSTKGSEAAGSGPGYGIFLYAESTTGCIYGSKRVANKNDSLRDGVSSLTSPEDLGDNCAKQLCEQIAQGGAVDASHQPLLFLLMILTPEAVSKAKVGKLTPFTIQYLKLLFDFFGVKFKLTVTDSEEEKLSEQHQCVVTSCRGLGFTNISRRVT